MLFGSALGSQLPQKVWRRGTLLTRIFAQNIEKGDKKPSQIEALKTNRKTMPKDYNNDTTNNAQINRFFIFFTGKRFCLNMQPRSNDSSISRSRGSNINQKIDPISMQNPYQERKPGIIENTVKMEPTWTPTSVQNFKKGKKACDKCG